MVIEIGPNLMIVLKTIGIGACIVLFWYFLFKSL
jgi:hypothetical protein